VVVGVGCLGLSLAQRCLAAEARLLHVLKGLARTLQVEEEVENDLVQHPDVFLGEVAVAELGCIFPTPPHWGIVNMYMLFSSNQFHRSNNYPGQSVSLMEEETFLL